MLLFGFEAPNVLLKVVEKKEYADALVNGDVYMKSSGYFRAVENEYRGDKYDGKTPINTSDCQISLANDIEGEEIELHGVDCVTLGFENDDKINMFCATVVTEDILVKTSEISMKFHPEYLNEIKQFGNYIVTINLDEFVVKIAEELKSIKAGIKYGAVEYVDIMNEYKLDRFMNINGDYDTFFKKDKSYKWQNEWRLILVAEEEIIDNDYLVFSVGKLESASVLELEKLINSEIKVEES